MSSVHASRFVGSTWQIGLRRREVFDIPAAGSVNSGRANQASPSTCNDVVAEARGCKLEELLEAELPFVVTVLP